MRECYFCGESNSLVLENAHLIPRSVGKDIFNSSRGKINVEKTITLCRNCHKKFEMLLRPFVKYAQLQLDEEKTEETKSVEVFGYLGMYISGADNSFLDICFEPWLDTSAFAHLPIANRKVIDKALTFQHKGKYAKFIVKNGFVLDIIPAKLPKKEVDIIMTGKPKSVRDKLSTILGLISSMEKETGMVEKARLLERLQTEYDIGSSEAERLIGQMLKEGTLFYAKDGYLKKT